MTKPSAGASPADPDQDMFEAGQFWLRALCNPTLRRFGASFHAVLFVALALAARYLGPLLDEPNLYTAAKYTTGGLAVFMAAFGLIVSATLANDIVKSGKVQPPGYGGGDIAELTGATLMQTLAAAIIFGLMP